MKQVFTHVCTVPQTLCNTEEDESGNTDVPTGFRKAFSLRIGFAEVRWNSVLRSWTIYCW